MREDRAGRQCAELLEPLQRAVPAAAPGIGNVGGILRHVHMQDGAQITAQRRGVADRVVRHRERGVQPDHAAHQRPLVGLG